MIQCELCPKNIPKMSVCRCTRGRNCFSLSFAPRISPKCSFSASHDDTKGRKLCCVTCASLLEAEKALSFCHGWLWPPPGAVTVPFLSCFAPSPLDVTAALAGVTAAGVDAATVIVVTIPTAVLPIGEVLRIRLKQQNCKKLNCGIFHELLNPCGNFTNY